MLTDRCRWHCNCTQAGIEDESIDVATSNCVINLSPAKPQVIQGVYDALKWGGEFYFSDIYASRRLPTAVQQHEGALPSGCCCRRREARQSDTTFRVATDLFSPLGRVPCRRFVYVYSLLDCVAGAARCRDTVTDVNARHVMVLLTQTQATSCAFAATSGSPTRAS